MDELIEIYGAGNAYSLLFFKSGLPQQVDPAAPPMTRLAHAKKYVIETAFEYSAM